MRQLVGLSRNRVGVIVVAAAIGMIGMAMILASRADSPAASFETENGDRTLLATIVCDTKASNKMGVKFNAARPEVPFNNNSAKINGITKPGPTNTGPTDRAALKPSSSINITTDGAVVENVAVTGKIAVTANNVTIRNFTIDASGKSYGIETGGSNNITIEHGEIFNMSSAAIFGMGFTARYLDIHDSDGDGVKAQGGGGGPVLLENNWLHHLGKGDCAHADGNQTRKAVSDIVYRYNNCDIPVTVPIPYKSNACFMLQEAEGPVKSFLIEYNWLNGGNYTIYCVPNTTVNGNRFGRDYRFGIDQGCNKWTNNVWDDTGQPADS
jgi:hypothetical protein